MIIIAGVDEVGYGAWAGPVVAAAVIIPEGFEIPGLRDSKKLSARKREKFQQLIYTTCQSSVGVILPSIIDEINILEATHRAMRRAVEGLRFMPDLLYIDGLHRIPGLKIKQKPIVRGDDIHPCISAASIVAKVYRDNLMVEYSKKYPRFGFEKHKGYGTKLHREALERYGPTIIHRHSFAPVKKIWRARNEKPVSKS